MPFTVTHIAAIVPISRFAPQLPFAALALGSMIPDAPIFLSFGYGYSFMHSVPGLLLACLPAGLIAFYLFEHIFKAPIVSLLPNTVARRLQTYAKPDRRASPKHLIAASTAIVIGASTHILWDLFTHGGRWGVQHIPALQATYPIFGNKTPGFQLAQHGSSLLFLPMLVFMFVRLIAKAEPTSESSDLFAPSWLKSATRALIVATPFLTAYYAWTALNYSLHAFAFYTTVISGTVILITTIAYSVAVNRLN